MSVAESQAGIASIDLVDVQRAAKNLTGYAFRTPVLTSRIFNAMVESDVYFKCENFQRGGSFKFRGAFNAISSLTSEARARGVVAFSSGNHAIAIALASNLLRTRAIVVMPIDTPQAKLAGARNYGAEVILYDRHREDRESIASRLVNSEGLSLIPPFNDPNVISGQGTATLELIEEVGDLDYVFVCVGGGGLISGTAIATQIQKSRCIVVGVEPERGNDGQQSMAGGKIIKIAPPDTIADGARTQALGSITFPIMQALVSEIKTVSDVELKSQMRFFAERMKIVTEPTGCLAAAGVLKYSEMLKGKKVGVIVSGGNVDISMLTECLQGE